MLERLAQGGLIKGKTIGADSTTLEANAVMKFIVQQDTGGSYAAYLKQLAEAEGMDAKDAAADETEITKLKDGRTALAYKAENPVDRENRCNRGGHHTRRGQRRHRDNRRDRDPGRYRGGGQTSLRSIPLSVALDL